MSITYGWLDILKHMNYNETTGQNLQAHINEEESRHSKSYKMLNLTTKRVQNNNIEKCFEIMQNTIQFLIDNNNVNPMKMFEQNNGILGDIFQMLDASILKVYEFRDINYIKIDRFTPETLIHKVDLSKVNLNLLKLCAKSFMYDLRNVIFVYFVQHVLINNKKPQDDLKIFNQNCVTILETLQKSYVKLLEKTLVPLGPQCDKQHVVKLMEYVNNIYLLLNAYDKKKSLAHIIISDTINTYVNHNVQGFTLPSELEFREQTIEQIVQDICVNLLSIDEDIGEESATLQYEQMTKANLLNILKDWKKNKSKFENPNVFLRMLIVISIIYKQLKNVDLPNGYMLKDYKFPFNGDELSTILHQKCFDELKIQKVDKNTHAKWLKLDNSEERVDSNVTNKAFIQLSDIIANMTQPPPSSTDRLYKNLRKV